MQQIKTLLGAAGVALAVLCAFTTLPLLPTPAAACVGTPPPPLCGKTLVLSLAGHDTLLSTETSFDVPVLVYFRMLDFPSGAGICPDGPYAVDLDLTVTCTPAGDGGGTLLSAALVPGYNPYAVPVTVAAGPPRRCSITGSATVTLADGMVLTDLDNDAEVCIADAAPGSPNVPRLDFENLTGDIRRSHPGDQNLFKYRITNNDPTATFDYRLIVETKNTSDMPGTSGLMPPGTGPFAIADELGDHARPAFNPDLEEGCVVLTPDPIFPGQPEIRQSGSLGPGQSRNVNVWARHWGMCADGSCSVGDLFVEGTFSDLTDGFGCSSFITAADTSVPPTYAWPTSGQSAQFFSFAPNSVTALSKPAATAIPVELDLTAGTIQFLVNGVPASEAPILLADNLDDRRGRIRTQLVPVGGLAVDSIFGVSFDITVAPSSSHDTTVHRAQLTGGPAGGEMTVPAGEITVDIDNLPADLTVDSFFDIIYQIELIALDNAGERRPVAFLTTDIQTRGDGEGFIVSLGSGQAGSGAGSSITALELNQDFRGFASESIPFEPLIFTDGFESGDVSSWSRSVP